MGRDSGRTRAAPQQGEEPCQQAHGLSVPDAAKKARRKKTEESTEASVRTQVTANISPFPGAPQGKEARLLTARGGRAQAGPGVGPRSVPLEGPEVDAQASEQLTVPGLACHPSQDL